MQFQGGYRYPGNRICGIFTLLAVITTLFLWIEKSFNLTEGLSLFLSLEGTVLLASSFTPVGMTPPPKGFTKKVRWFMNASHGLPLSYNQPMFYGGLLCLFIGIAI
jgi:hypothetical protein